MSHINSFCHGCYIKHTQIYCMVTHSIAVLCVGKSLWFWFDLYVVLNNVVRGKMNHARLYFVLVSRLQPAWMLIKIISHKMLLFPLWRSTCCTPPGIDQSNACGKLLVNWKMSAVDLTQMFPKLLNNHLADEIQNLYMDYTMKTMWNEIG